MDSVDSVFLLLLIFMAKVSRSLIVVIAYLALVLITLSSLELSTCIALWLAELSSSRWFHILCLTSKLKNFAIFHEVIALATS
jgi:hypothetical protein